jgi:hypothetical protein
MRVGGGVVDDPALKLMTLNVTMYVQSTNVVTGIWKNVASVPPEFRPWNTVHWRMPLRVDATKFATAGGTSFTGSSLLAEAEARLQPNGDLDIWINSVVSPASANGNSWYILPFHQTYFWLASS